ncbi:DNA-directed DNA polymerase [Dinochytrium kinnereticum]|nr:DNA-directed DNA polymerase [Dinochytrium kinnereticum]
MATTLDLYWDLASLDASVRLKAAQSLSMVIQQAAQIVPKDASIKGGEESGSQSFPHEISYGLRRLLRGLPSSRDGARQGFAVALTELIHLIPSIQLDEILDLLESVTAVTNSMKGQEQREMLFGRLFGLRAIHLSGAILRDHASADELSRICEMLLACGNSKIFLREACFEILIGFISTVSTNSFALKDELLARIPSIVAKALSGGITNIEQLWLAVYVQYNTELLQDVKIDWSELIPTWKKAASILHRENAEMLVPILKESSFPIPRLHCVWDTIADIIFAKRCHMSLQEFWSLCVDEALMTSTHDRKYSGLTLFEKLLPRLAASDVALVFTPRFLTCLVNSLAQPSTYLNKTAKSALRQIIKISESNSDVCLQVMIQLQGRSGNAIFDSITKASTILANSLSSEGLGKYIDFLFGKFLNPEVPIDETASRSVDLSRTWSLDQLLAIIRNKRIVKTEDDVLRICNFLALYSAITVQKSFKLAALHVKEPVPPLSKALQAQCGTRLLSILGLIYVPLGPEKSKGTSGQIVKPTLNYAVDVLDHIDAIASKKTSVSLNFGTKSLGFIAKTLETIKKLAPNENASITDNYSTQYSRKLSVATLLTFIILQARITTDDLADVSEELLALAELLLKKETKDKSSKRKSPTSSDSQPESIERLVDILISIISQPSQLFRKAAQSVFETFIEEITESTVDLLLNALKAKADDEGFEIEEENSDDDINGSEKNDDEEKESSDGTDVESQLEIPFVVSSFQPNESDGNDADESDEDVVGDDEMEEYDKKLAEIFKEKKRISLIKKNAKVEFLHMKLRYCDLLDVFFKHHTSTPVAFYALPNTLQLINQQYSSPESKDIAARIEGIIRNRVCKVKDSAALELSLISDCLREVHQVALKATTIAIVKVCSDVSVFLLRLALKSSSSVFGVPAGLTSDTQRKKSRKMQLASLESPRQNPFVETFASSLMNFLTAKKSCLHISIFQKPLQAFPAFSVELLPHIIEDLKSSVIKKAFQFSQGFQLIALVYQNCKQLKNNSVAIERLGSLIPEVSSILLQLLRSIASGIDASPKGFTAERLKDIILYSKIIVKQGRDYNLTPNVCESWRTETLEESINAVSNIEYFSKPSLRNAFSELRSLTSA